MEKYFMIVAGGRYASGLRVLSNFGSICPEVSLRKHLTLRDLRIRFRFSVSPARFLLESARR
jgi:hypothetical protein